MIAIDRLVIVSALIIAGLVTTSAAFAAAPSPVTAAGLIPLVLVVEIIIYFVAAMVANARASIGMAMGTAIFYTIIRAVSSLIGAIIFQSLNGGLLRAANQEFSILLAWVSPFPMVIQMVVLLLAGPYLLAAIFPDLLGEEEAAKLGGTSAPTTRPATQTLDASPSGGFVQVFSFEELAGVLKKSHGIEGFVIYSNEGLVVWHDLPLRINIEALTGRLLDASIRIGNVMQGSGLTKVRRVMVETKEHFVFATTLNQNFGIMMVYNGRVAPEEVLSRIAVVAKTSREFLQWKYPSLPLAAGMNRDKLSLEIA
jgi:predicted regulator of Ras-like GTPase activity (Roadblock/LC7/MglB family)